MGIPLENQDKPESDSNQNHLPKEFSKSLKNNPYDFSEQIISKEELLAKSHSNLAKNPELKESSMNSMDVNEEGNININIHESKNKDFLTLLKKPITSKITSISNNSCEEVYLIKSEIKEINLNKQSKFFDIFIFNKIL
jgi:hypothetical protein